MEIEKIVTIIAQSIGAIATIIGTIVIVLTYLKAKQTFFQPMRNEVFKLQLDLFSKIMKMLCDKDEGRIWDLFNFEEIITYNAHILEGAYSFVYFNLVPDWAWILRDEDIDEHMESYDEKEQEWIPFLNNRVKGKSFFLGPYFDPGIAIPEEIEERQKVWDTYKQVAIYLPNSFWEKERQVKDFYTSPLLPKNIAALLKEYDEAIFKNLVLLTNALTSVAREMPNTYPTKESIKELGLVDNWVRNEFIGLRHRQQEVIEPAKKIAEKIREYMGTEAIFRTD